MATAEGIIYEALELLGLQSANEPLTDEDADTGLRTLNNLIDKWNVSKLKGYSQVQLSFPLQANKAEYTIGPGGDFETDRPVRIEDMLVRDPNNQELDYSVKGVSFDEYNAIRLKTITSYWPRWFYYNPEYPLGTIKFYPVPSQNYTVYIEKWFKFGNYADKTDTVDLPDGYNDLIVYELAFKLSPKFRVAITREMREERNEIRMKINNLNAKQWKPDFGTTTPASNRGGDVGEAMRTFIPRTFA